MIGDNETNFSHKLLLTNRQVSNLRKAFANHLSADIKLSKTQLSHCMKKKAAPFRKCVLLRKYEIFLCNSCA